MRLILRLEPLKLLTILLSKFPTVGNSFPRWHGNGNFLILVEPAFFGLFLWLVRPVVSQVPVMSFFTRWRHHWHLENPKVGWASSTVRPLSPAPQGGQ